MVVIDDHLALSVLSGRRSLTRPGERAPSIPWGLHFRLVRALLDIRTRGRLSSGIDERVLRVVMAPSTDLLRVLDPRHLTVTAARLMTQHPLSIVGAELLSAGIVLDTPVLVTDGNMGRSWHEVARAEGIELRVEPSNPTHVDDSGSQPGLQ